MAYNKARREIEREKERERDREKFIYMYSLHRVKYIGIEENHFERILLTRVPLSKCCGEPKCWVSAYRFKYFNKSGLFCLLQINFKV